MVTATVAANDADALNEKETNHSDRAKMKPQKPATAAETAANLAVVVAANSAAIVVNSAVDTADDRSATLTS